MVCQMRYRRLYLKLLDRVFNEAIYQILERSRKEEPLILMYHIAGGDPTVYVVV